MAEAASATPRSMASRLWSLLNRMSSPSGVLLTAMLLLAFVPVTVQLNDPDFWWHLKAGQLLIKLGHLVGTDPFTYTASTHHWTMHEWLSEVVFAELVRIGGLALFVVVLSVVTYIGIVLIFARAQLDRPLKLVAALGLILGVFVGDPIWGPRVQMETFTLACATLLLAELHLRRPAGRIAWLLVPLYLLWSNLHGGFVIGPIFLVIILVAETIGNWVGWPDSAPTARIKSLALIALLATLVTLINLNGPTIIFYAFETQFSTAQQLFIEEWQSPNFHLWELFLFYAPMILSLAFMIVYNRRIRPRDAALVVVSLVLSLQSVRNIALLVATGTPVWITQADMIVRRWQGRQRTQSKAPPLRLRLTVLGLIAVLCLAVDVGRAASAMAPQYNSFYYAVNFPVCAARWLGQDKQPLTIFNQYGDGGYLSLTLSSQGDKVYIFGDAALMGDPLLYTYNEIQDLAANWDQLLYSSGTQVVLFVAGTPLATVLAKSPHWTLVYHDPRDVIFARTDLLHSLDLPPPATIPANPSDPCHELSVTPQSEWPQ